MYGKVYLERKNMEYINLNKGRWKKMGQSNDIE